MYLYILFCHVGEEDDRIRLAEGAVPETVAASLAQRKRWAKGSLSQSSITLCDYIYKFHIYVYAHACRR